MGYMTPDVMGYMTPDMMGYMTPDMMGYMMGFKCTHRMEGNFTILCDNAVSQFLHGVCFSVPHLGNSAEFPLHFCF